MLACCVALLSDIVAVCIPHGTHSVGLLHVVGCSVLAITCMQDEDYIKSTSDKLPDLGKKMEYMLNTGNLVSKSGLDISQATGFTVVAEKLNFFR